MEIIQKIKRKKIYLFFISLMFGVFFYSHSAWAWGGTVETGVSKILAFIVQAQFYISATLLYMGGSVLDLVIGHAVDVHNMRAVELGWSLARDTVNMFFVIFLLVIAFATILRIESYHYKQLLPKLVVSILLVNFSRTICSVLIEFSNVLTGAFLNFGGGGSSAAGIAALMGLTSVYDLDSSFDVTAIDNFSMLISFILATMIVTGTAWVFCALAGMMLLRTVALLVLIVLSPMAFGMNILPLTQTYFKRWWDEFVKYLFYAPIAAFCLYLSAVVVSEARGIGASGNSGLGLGDVISDGGAAASGNMTNNLLPGAFTNTEYMWEFGLALGLLSLSVLMIQEGGGIGASIAMNAAKKGMFGAYGLAGRALGSGAKWGAKRGLGFARRKAASDKTGKEGMMRWNKGGAWNKISGGLLRGANWLGNATYLPQAWEAQREKEEADVSGMSVGWGRSRINEVMGKIPGSLKDDVDYE